MDGDVHREPTSNSRSKLAAMASPHHALARGPLRVSAGAVLDQERQRFPAADANAGDPALFLLLN
jgi:hypothetical protein